MPRSKSKSKEAKGQQTQMVDARPTRKKRPPTKLVETPSTKRKRVAETPISTTEQIESTAENNAKDIAQLKEQIEQQSIQQQLINQQQKLIELFQSNTNQNQKKEKIKKSSTATSRDSDSDSESMSSESDSAQSESDTESIGECKVTYTKKKPSILGALSVGQAVPNKIKKQIWKNKYVDLADLLHPHGTNHMYTLSVNTNNFSSTPALNFTAKKTTKRTK